MLGSIALLWRVRLGVHFSDEANAVALSYWFANGRELYRDETLTLLQHLYGFLSYLVSLRDFFVSDDGREGIILYFRALYAFASISIGWGWFILLRERGVSAACSLLGALVWVSWIPTQIPSLNYNTVGPLGLSASLLFYGLANSAEKRASALIFLSGTFFALSIFAYPSQLTLAPLYFFIVFFTAKWRRYTLLWMIGLSISGGLFVSFLFTQGFFEGWSQLKAFTEAAGRRGGGIEKIYRFLDDLTWIYPMLGGVLLSGLVLLKARMNGLILLGVLGVVGCLLWALGENFRNWDHSIAVLLLSLIPLLVFGFILERSSDLNSVLRKWGFLGLGLIACLLGAYSGSSPLGGLVVFAAVPLTFFASSFEILYGRKSWLPKVLGGVVVLFLLASSWFNVYRDDSVGDLNTRIERGAYSGLYTTERKAAWIRELEEELGSLAKKHRSVAIFDHFPAGYLMSAMKPETPNLWIASQLGYRDLDRNWYLRGFEKLEPDLILVIDEVQWSKDQRVRYYLGSGDPIREKFELKPYQMVKANEGYRFYSKLSGI